MLVRDLMKRKTQFAEHILKDLAGEACLRALEAKLMAEAYKAKNVLDGQYGILGGSKELFVHRD